MIRLISEPHARWEVARFLPVSLARARVNMISRSTLMGTQLCLFCDGVLLRVGPGSLFTRWLALHCLSARNQMQNLPLLGVSALLLVACLVGRMSICL